jgi:hypothetical protein
VLSEWNAHFPLQGIIYEVPEIMDGDEHHSSSELILENWGGTADTGKLKWRKAKNL